MMASSATSRGRGRPCIRTPTNTQAAIKPNLAHELVRLICAAIPTIMEEQRHESSRRTVVTKKHVSYKDFIKAAEAALLAERGYGGKKDENKNEKHKWDEVSLITNRGDPARFTCDDSGLSKRIAALRLVNLQCQVGTQGLESVSIRHIQGFGYGVLEFLRVGTMFDIFQNIHILYFQYGVLAVTGYGVLIKFPLWFLVSAGMDTLYLP
ncbi:hypothetical protein Tco_0838868 [Tanacetum coccineum]|uniref:Uncharacterized protein n=1 Tax=Tanacetum coccineum TaxID=301880 RepID=A0ABQ5AQ30_9ASTR